MRIVVWSERASADFKQAIDFIADDSPEAATNVANRIRSAGNGLGRHSTGRPARISRWFEKSLPDIRYIILYSLDDPPGTVNILRVIHTSRDWNPGEPPPA